jgi:O-antigen ligase
MVDRVRPEDPAPDALARLPQPERVLTGGGFRAVRRVALAALAVGLGVSITLSEISLGLLAGVLLVTAIARGRLRPGAPGRGLPLFWPIVGFSVWTIVAALASERPLESVIAAKGVVWLATVWLLVTALEAPAETRAFIRVFLATMLVVSAVGVVQVLACPADGPPGGAWDLVFRKCARARGFYSIYMTLAGVLMMTMVATLPWLIRGPLRFTWLGGGWLLAGTALALTQVRGAWAGLIVGVVVVAAVTGRRVILVGLAALALVTIVASPTVRARFTYDQSADDRFAMIAGGFAIARDHPVTGIGPGQVKHVYPAYAVPSAHRRSTSHLHDAPMQILVERGVIGLALWVSIFAAFFSRAGSIYRALGPAAADQRALVLGSMAAIAAFLAAGFFEYNFGDTEVLLVACALMAVPFIVARTAHPEPAPPADP